MGCFRRVLLWWEVRREARRIRKLNKKAAKTAAKSNRDSKFDVDSIPVSGVAPTQRKFASGGFAFNYELSPSKTPNIPRLTPVPNKDQQLASLLERRKAYEARLNLNSNGDLDSHIALNLRELDARCRRSRRAQKFINIVKRGEAMVATPAADNEATVDADAGGITWNRTHLDGPPSQ